MTSLTVWHYPTPYGADAAEVRLKRLEETGDITVHDLVTLVWPPTEKRPRIGHRGSHRHDVFGGAAWGALLGTVLGGPLAGVAAGAAAGEARHRVRGPLIDEAVVTRLRDEFTPGTSAMFVLSSGGNIPAVEKVLARDQDARLLHYESDTPLAGESLDAWRSRQDERDS